MQQNIEKNITTVIFDLGRVLVDLDLNLFIKLAPQSTNLQCPESIVNSVISSPIVADFNKGKISVAQFHAGLCSKFNIDLTIEEFTKLWCSIFKPMDNIEPLAAALAKKYNLGLISNTDTLHWNYLKNQYSSVLDYFEYPILSYEVAILKPDAEIFLLAAEKYQAHPCQCVYIDDLAINTEAAKSLGFNAVHFTSPAALAQILTGMDLICSADIFP